MSFVGSIPKLSDDEIENIRNIINPTEEETNGSRVDFDCKYGKACYTTDYKKFIRLSFYYCCIAEGTQAILKILDGTITICSNAINSERQEQIFLPDSLLYIGDNAIDCKSLKEILLPQSLRYIGNSAFWGCGSLRKIIIPKNVGHIGTAAFSNTGIKEIVCNSPAFSICNYALYDDSGNRMIKYFGSENKVIVPPNVNDITGAFAGCKDIEHITLPQGLTSIGERTFMNCSRLRTIVIQEGVQEIGQYAFMQCHCLEYIIIPEGVKSIREFCFDYCQNLRYIVLPSTIEQIGSKDPDYSDFGIFDEECISLKYIFIPKGTKEKYAAADVWKDFSAIMEYDPTGISSILSDSKAKVAKHLVNGRLIIEKDGKRYDACGAEMK